MLLRNRYFTYCLILTVYLALFTLEANIYELNAICYSSHISSLMVFPFWVLYAASCLTYYSINGWVLSTFNWFNIALILFYYNHTLLTHACMCCHAFMCCQNIHCVVKSQLSNITMFCADQIKPHMQIYTSSLATSLVFIVINSST